MIQDTNADCKITDISIQQNIALISCVIFSNAATRPSQAFRFFLKDMEDNSIELLSEKVYWIDNTNNALGTKNINVNKYKEVLLQIDISKDNTAQIKNKHWVRECVLYLVNTQNTHNAPAWKSNTLTLVSAEFEIPEIKYQFQKIYELKDDNGIRDDNDEYYLQTVFKLNFPSSKKSLYDYKQFRVIQTIKDVTGLVIYEQAEFSVDAEINSVRSEKSYRVKDTVVVSLQIVDLAGNIYDTDEHYYRVVRINTKCYIKTPHGVKKVLAIYKKTRHAEE